MYAVVFHEYGGPEKLAYQEVPRPIPADHEVLIQVKACSINHLDIWVRNGIPAYKISLPHIPGSDIAGVIAETGKQVEGAHPGDRVVVYPILHCHRCEYCLAGQENLCTSVRVIGVATEGGYAQYSKVPQENIFPLPEAVSFEEGAAFVLVYLTAWHMLITLAQLKPGQEVLVLAAGSGVGSAAIQIAKLVGARVIATVGDRDKISKAQAIGADEVINHREEDLTQRTRDLTRGRGVDVVFEHIGPETWSKSIACLAKNGTLVTCGATTGPEAKMDLRYLFTRQLRLIGSYIGTRRELISLLKLLGEGRLKPHLHAVMPLKEARRAHEIIEERKHFGKLVLVPDHPAA
jgi:NADPH:quinone reductase-like Zn-dependent oxidoreductase